MAGYIKLTNIIDEDFVNYKVPSMTLIFPYCTFKCGMNNCQNKDIAKDEPIDVSIEHICKKYRRNKITEAIVCQGLEPFDSFDELFEFVYSLRLTYCIPDTVVIYTGYNKNEIEDKIEMLKIFPNIIVKYGRYIPEQKPHYDKVLGVNLASDNQYAEELE